MCKAQTGFDKMAEETQQELTEYILTFLREGFLDQMVPWVQIMVTTGIVGEEQKAQIMKCLQSVWQGHPRWA